MLHLRLTIFSVGGDILIDSETFLMTDFMNLKIKSAQLFGDVHMGRIYIRVFIGMSSRIYINICVCTIFLKDVHKLRDARALS
jgi:hypothetical protein